MPGIRITIDPDGAPLQLSAANGYHLLSPLRQKPAPLVPQWASGISTEGELSTGGKRGNAQIIPRLRISGASEDEFRTAQVRLQQKLYKLEQEAGVLRIHMPDDSYIDWCVRGVEAGERLFDNRYIHRKRTEDEITFICAPFGLGEPEEVTVTLEHAGPVLVTQPFEVLGSAPALASALISAENDQWWLRAGIESRTLSEDPTAGCYYPAADLTPLGGATVTSGVIRQGTLSPTPQAMLSTEIAGVGQMTHVGVYEVFAVVRTPTTNDGEVSVYLEWATGNRLRPTANKAATFEVNHSRQGQDVLVSLGEVRLRDVDWEGRLIASSTITGDDLDVKWVGFVPLPECNATVSDVPRLQPPSSILARDDFKQPAGNLHGVAAAVGGPWTEHGVAGNFVVDAAGDNVQRASVSDAGGGRGRQATLAVGLDLVVVRTALWFSEFTHTSAGGLTQGVVARHLDSDNFASFAVGHSFHPSFGVSSASAFIQTWTGGNQTNIDVSRVSLSVQTWYEIVLMVDAQGRAWGWFGPSGGLLRLVASGWSDHLETGGVLESGDAGIFDEKQGASAVTRAYDNPVVWQPPAPGLLFGGLGVEWADDRVRHQGPDGRWGDAPDHRTDFLRVPPSGVENRKTRLVVLPSRTDPARAAYPDPGDLSIESLTVTPRYLTVPDPA